MNKIKFYARSFIRTFHFWESHWNKMFTFATY